MNSQNQKLSTVREGNPYSKSSTPGHILDALGYPYPRFSAPGDLSVQSSPQQGWVGQGCCRVGQRSCPTAVPCSGRKHTVLGLGYWAASGRLCAQGTGSPRATASQQPCSSTASSIHPTCRSQGR